MNMIALERVSLRMGKFRLYAVDLCIPKGEYLVIIGPSGAGKTVLLETIAGLRAPDSGRIFINGADASGILPEERHIALVYQDYSLFPHMTAFENIAFGLRLRKIHEADIDRRVRSLLTQFGILHCSEHYPSSMSGGEQQRVAIARALATDPSVLLLDEPFASLDPRNRDECIRVMQDLKESRSVTIIQVSHSCDEAYALADQAAVLLNGMIAQTGSPDEIFFSPKSPDIARFIGMENVLTGSVLNKGAGNSRLLIGTATIQLPVSITQSTRINIGIPASCIRIVLEKPGSDEDGMTCLPCQVARVIRGRDMVMLTLEGAFPLSAAIPRHNCCEIPRKGARVYAVFHNINVRVLSGDPR